VDTNTINTGRNALRKDLPDIVGRIGDEVEVETNIDFQLVDGRIRVIKKMDVAAKIKVKLDDKVEQYTGNKIPLEVSFKQYGLNPDRRVVSVKIGKADKGGCLSIERDTLGKTKVSFQEIPLLQADAEMNSRTGVFGGGVTLKFKDLTDKLTKQGPSGAKVASVLKGLEVQLQLGFVGTRPETILAVINNGPGFFGRRSIEKLLGENLHWVDLTAYEQAQLAALGWYGEVWDYKYRKEYKSKLPDSLNKSPLDLTAVEQCAIVNLGFYAFEDYRHDFKKHVVKFADYSY
jgi:hypothetical protein